MFCIVYYFRLSNHSIKFNIITNKFIIRIYSQSNPLYAKDSKLDLFIGSVTTFAGISWKMIIPAGIVVFFTISFSSMVLNVECVAATVGKSSERDGIRDTMPVSVEYLLSMWLILFQNVIS